MINIGEIAKILDDCANYRHCKECPYYITIGLSQIEKCRSKLIKKMGEECRKIVEQMEDDLK